MGVGRFFQGGNSAFFQGSKNDEILFYSLETEKTTIFAEKFSRKMSTFKIKGAQGPPVALPTPMYWTMPDKTKKILVTYQKVLCVKALILNRKYHGF